MDISKNETLYGCGTVVISALSFQFISMCVSKFLTPGPERLPRENNKVWRWKNVLVSMCHSTIAGLWTIACFYDAPNLATDMINAYSKLSHTLVSVSVGYFLYDIADMMRFCRERSSYELLLHHITVITAFSVAVFTQQYIAYATVSLLIELNSIFLHMRQLFQLIKVSRKNTLYRLNSLLNIGTYILFRIGVLAWMTRWLFMNHTEVPLPLYTIASLGLATMTVMNIILFYRLINADFFKENKERTVAKEE